MTTAAGGPIVVVASCYRLKTFSGLTKTCFFQEKRNSYIYSGAHHVAFPVVWIMYFCVKISLSLGNSCGPFIYRKSRHVPSRFHCLSTICIFPLYTENQQSDIIVFCNENRRFFNEKRCFFNGKRCFSNKIDAFQ